MIFKLAVRPLAELLRTKISDSNGPDWQKIIKNS